MENAWGLYDMQGNVWEWCADRYREYSPRSLNSSGDTLPEANPDRIVRGGGWYSEAVECRCAALAAYTQDWRDSDIGFRIVREDEL